MVLPKKRHSGNHLLDLDLKVRKSISMILLGLLISKLNNVFKYKIRIGILGNLPLHIDQNVHRKGCF